MWLWIFVYRQFLRKLTNTIWSNNAIPKYYSRKMKTLCWHKHLHTNIYGSSIQNYQKAYVHLIHRLQVTIVLHITRVCCVIRQEGNSHRFIPESVPRAHSFSQTQQNGFKRSQMQSQLHNSWGNKITAMKKLVTNILHEHRHRGTHAQQARGTEVEPGRRAELH